MSTPELRAYREAWRERQETGNTSRELLLARLRANGANPVLLDPSGDGHQWLMNCWGKGVSPAKLSLEATKKVGGLVPTIVKPLREMLRYLK